MIHSSTPRPERILLYGNEGTAKSSAWLSVASWIARTKADSKMYVCDTDNAWSAMNPYTLDDVVVVENCPDYPDIKTTLSNFRKAATKNDWLVVDMIDVLWQKSQDHFLESVHGDLDEFFIELRKRDGQLGEDWTWQYINKLYALLVENVQRFPGNVIACAPANIVAKPNRQGKGGDRAEVLEVYGRIGFKPAGQKKLGHLFHDVLYTARTPDGEFKITTAKVRNPPGTVNKRQEVKGLTIPKEPGMPGDFFWTYLRGIGGWKL